ncbi:hypothetical protein [Tenacibaculum sp. 190524A02b]|uniref:hypothetical protein n=1 Tax=Tenacibaculum vairaonense TaxID=3137860 RepID=UPI0031FAF764
MRLTKTEFIDILNSLKEQSDYDKRWVKSLGDVLGGDLSLPNNSRLVNQLFNILHSVFPPKDNVCMIQAFCYDYNYGRADGYKGSVSDLWESLIAEYKKDKEWLEMLG